MKYKIGDIVRFIGRSNDYIINGSIGRVIYACDKSLEARWDTFSTDKDGINNWWAAFKDIELMEVVNDKTLPKNGDLVVIKDGFRGDRVKNGVIGKVYQVHSDGSDYSWVECLLGDFKYIEPRKQDMPRIECDLPANCYCIGNSWLGRLKPTMYLAMASDKKPSKKSKLRKLIKEASLLMEDLKFADLSMGDDVSCERVIDILAELTILTAKGK